MSATERNRACTLLEHEHVRYAETAQEYHASVARAAATAAAAAAAAQSAPHFPVATVAEAEVPPIDSPVHDSSSDDDEWGDQDGGSDLVPPALASPGGPVPVDLNAQFRDCHLRYRNFCKSINWRECVRG